MKILYIANNSTNDFLSDAVFHGLKSLSWIEVTESRPLWYMYKNIDKESLVTKFHGRGFTYYADLPPSNVDRSNIKQKIEGEYFDRIIYGNMLRCDDYFGDVIKIYSKEQIIALDGEDLFVGDINTVRSNQNKQLEDFCTVYKRESLNNSGSERPISFAFPEEKISNFFTQKEKLLAHIIPGISETYIFNNESDYFMDYRKSMFAYTWRKAGWDCLRHYEILCNNCIPLFIDIEYCPQGTCTTLPKNILVDYYKSSGLYNLFKMDKPFTYDIKGGIITNRDLSAINTLEIDEDFFDLYFRYLKKLNDYSKSNLTTKTLAQYILGQNTQNN